MWLITGQTSGSMVWEHLEWYFMLFSLVLQILFVTAVAINVVLTPIVPLLLVVPGLRTRRMVSLILAQQAGALYFVAFGFVDGHCGDSDRVAAWCHLARPVFTGPFRVLWKLIYEHESLLATVFQIAFGYMGVFVVMIIPAVIVSVIFFVGLRRLLADRDQVPDGIEA